MQDVFHLTRSVPLSSPIFEDVDEDVDFEGPSPPENDPDLIAALLRTRLGACDATQQLQLEVAPLPVPLMAPTANPDSDSCLEPPELHLQLTDRFCPDPLLMMNHLGETLAALPEGRPRRVSFSGGSDDREAPTWIGFIDVDAFGTTASAALEPSTPLSRLQSSQDYERFITDESSWFTPTVKEKNRLHAFAKTTQRKRISDTAMLLAEVLAPGEALLDVLPMRYRRQTGSLILTNQRLWCACESLRLQRFSAQDFALSLSEIQCIEIADNGLRIRDQSLEHCIYFSSSAAQNLEILLSYFFPVTRRDVIPEKIASSVSPILGVGLVASLVLGIGWTVSGFTDFFMEQVPLEQAQVIAADGADRFVDALPRPLNDSAQQRCIEQFNRVMYPKGYGALNRTTKTMRIRLEQFTGDYVNGVEFDAVAEAIANRVFSTCDQTSVDQVRIEDGHYSFFKGRFSPRSLVEQSFSR